MVIGTVVIPGISALLLALPFVDRSPERHPFHRKKSVFAAIVIVILLAVLSLMAYVQHFANPPLAGNAEHVEGPLLLKHKAGCLYVSSKAFPDDRQSSRVGHDFAQKSLPPE
jgi:hypothetical protein